jgi:hypothetical protein
MVQSLVPSPRPLPLLWLSILRFVGSSWLSLRYCSSLPDSFGSSHRVCPSPCPPSTCLLAPMCRIIVFFYRVRFAMELVGCYSQCFAPSILRFVQSVQWFAQSVRWFAQSVRLFAQSGPAFCTVGVILPGRCTGPCILHGRCTGLHSQRDGGCGYVSIPDSCDVTKKRPRIR